MLLPPVRWLICGFLLAITTHAFITRMAMGVAARQIQLEFALTNVQVGWILSAFILGYGIVQFPVGILTDRIGPHRLLAATLFSWSAFHVLTGFAAGSIVVTLMAIRFCMGIAQATVLPCSIKTIAGWMPLSERATANGVFMMGLGIGGAVTGPLTVALMTAFNWRFPFYVLGAIGMALALGWWHYGADSPKAREVSNRREPVERAPTPWRELFRSRSVWCLALSYGVAGYASYVFFTWFFLYIVNVRNVDIRAGGYWSGLPYVMIAIMAPLGGRVSDLLTSRYGKRPGRLSVVLTGASAAAALIIAGSRAEDVRLAVVLLSLGAGFHLFAQAPSWAATIDIAPEHSATLFGIMNTMAQLAGACAPVLTPMIAERFGWTSALDFAALMAAGAGALWLVVRPERPLALVRTRSARLTG
jgi:MFS transporter, ACS family, glucarate transporter